MHIHILNAYVAISQPNYQFKTIISTFFPTVPLIEDHYHILRSLDTSHSSNDLKVSFFNYVCLFVHDIYDRGMNMPSCVCGSHTATW